MITNTLTTLHCYILFHHSSLVTFQLLCNIYSTKLSRVLRLLRMRYSVQTRDFLVSDNELAVFNNHVLEIILVQFYLKACLDYES